ARSETLNPGGPILFESVPTPGSPVIAHLSEIERCQIVNERRRAASVKCPGRWKHPEHFSDAMLFRWASLRGHFSPESSMQIPAGAVSHDDRYRDHRCLQGRRRCDRG